MKTVIPEAAEGRVGFTSQFVHFSIPQFWSAFLLFALQPLLGKYLLPRFGGGPGVWTACMLFFQAGLLLGYIYAHWIVSAWRPRIQAVIHLSLLAISLLSLPVVLGRHNADRGPTGEIILLLAATAGLPYFLLASSGPLLQRWFYLTHPASSPYRLYALSNAGSLAALLSYPVAIEPLLRLGRQAEAWSWGYAAFALLSGWTARSVLAYRENPAEASRENAAPPAAPVIVFWLLLAACGSTLLLAATNQMCQEIAVVPFLWVLPLALYLLTFILSFESERWYDRRWLGILVGVTVPAACGVLLVGFALKVWIHITAYSLALFACCMICHGELARSKPAAPYLTWFYLAIAAGGTLGGVLVAVAAPRIFTGYSEFPLALAGCCLLGLARIADERPQVPRQQRGGPALQGAWRSRPRITPERKPVPSCHPAPQGWWRERPYWRLAPVAGLLTAFVTAVLVLVEAHGQDAIAAARNFYGVLRVSESSDRLGPKRVLTHGRITHGFQYVDAFKKSWPTAYYGRESAIGLALEHHPRRYAADAGKRQLRAGVIGLGAGTLAAYGRSGDSFRFYEINPEVARVAERYFTYLQDSAARMQIVLGDARVRMEQEAARGDFQHFDVLAVDAFSSDAIPTHLLTAECGDLYRKHLQPDGLLLLHISNQSLDLAPVARALALRLRWESLRIYSPGDDAKGTFRTTWVILTSNREFLGTAAIGAAATPWSQADRPPLLWTDDFASLWRVLR